MAIEILTTQAKDLAKNPLGIIALFILLVYGFACILFSTSAEILNTSERSPIIWFVVIFPIIVLGVFGWLVSSHHDKLYAPADYKDDKSFLSTITQHKSHLKPLEIENDDERSYNDNEEYIDDLLRYGEGFELISEQKQNIINELNRRNINNSDNKINILLQQLAAVQIEKWFEVVYNSLFGSQIKLLKKIKHSGNQNISRNELESYFNELRYKFNVAFENWTTDSYIQYLLDETLIDCNENTYNITTRGMEFLKLYESSRYDENSKSL